MAINTEVINIIKKITKYKKVTINSKIANTDNWDSLNHVLIIEEISKKYKVNISFTEMINISSIKDIIGLLKKKL
tara:strand:+ start:364 stop:588 length:225 start_codon:yes stop_codon:yes gene_type:complete